MLRDPGSYLVELDACYLGLFAHWRRHETHKISTTYGRLKDRPLVTPNRSNPL